MKMSIVFLILMGLVGAVCMALLTAGLAVRSRVTTAQPAPKAPVLMAAKKLEALTVLDESMVSVKTVPKEQAPASHYADPIQVTGRMLAVPVIEGQALTPACFAPEGAGFELAAKLSPGMRALTVELAFPAALKGFLYPGSIVDVLAAFKLPQTESSPGEAVATTLLESIQILAVDDRTLGQEEGQGKAESGGMGRQRCLVTLKVDSRQAEALELASEHGTVALAMRNPTDRNPITQDAMLLSKGKLGRMADLLSAMVPATPDVKEVKYEPPPPPDPPPAVEPAKEDGPEWQIEVYRALKKETVSCPAQ